MVHLVDVFNTSMFIFRSVTFDKIKSGTNSLEIKDNQAVSDLSPLFLINEKGNSKKFSLLSYRVLLFFMYIRTTKPSATYTSCSMINKD